MERLDTNLYKIFFEWDKEKSSSKLNCDYTRAEADTSLSKFKPAYGDYQLLPGEIYYWEFKLTFGVHFIVGIAEYHEDWENKPKLESKKEFYEQEGTFVYYNQGKIKSHTDQPESKYGDKFGMGDIVGVYLDTTKGSLSFTVNGKNQGPAFVTHKLKDKVYLPVCAMLIEGESLEVVT